ncbi:MAG: tetratricopeptide repeat protein [Saprospiraceae bacterium]|nr:tetratricopeptide repeat protein [Saprospiraceae bacterium]
MKKYSVLIFILFFYWMPSGFSQDGFEKGNQLFTQGDYQGAVDAWLAAKETDGGSFGLYYNLGNAYYRLQDLGHARLYYEKALLLKPYDQNTKDNISLVKSDQEESVEAIPVFFLKQWMNGLRDLFPVSVWMISGLLLLWLAFLLYFLDARGKLSMPPFWRKWLSAGLLTLGFMCLFGGLSRWKSIENPGTAVVIPSSVTLKIAPEAESQDVMTLYGGTKVFFEDKIGDWYKVVLLNGEEGWLPLSEIEKI